MNTSIQLSRLIIALALPLTKARKIRHASFIILGLLLNFSHWAAATINVQFPVQTEFKNVDLHLRAKLAQKLAIDLRYYCAPKVQGYCQQPMQELPDELADMLKRAKVGGVILFAENLVTPQQILQLTHALQQTAQPRPSIASAATQQAVIPLYIGIDQEGGRVSRLPQNEFLGFSGNMAMGATFAKYNTQFARAVSQRTAQYLQLLGINLNFAPVLDVNSNPDNPVINVRAYSQSPKVVAQLGAAYISAMQEYGIAVAAKHFPGHGDTFIDSHVGLPAVKHNEEVINRIDLYPFRAVISDKKTRPDMIMTAHIQYPGLDNTPFISEQNTSANEQDKQLTQGTVLPATLSRKILTGILRDQLAYDGIIITDALDMASITTFLNPTDAVIKSFEAGADITLMPYHISSPEDAIGFLDWLNKLTIYISQDNELVAKVNASYERIVGHKAKRKLNQWAQMPFADKQIALTEFDLQTNQRKQDEDLAMNLSASSFTQLKELAAPLHSQQRLLVVMPDKRRCQAFEHYWHAYTAQQTAPVHAISCISLLSETIPLASGQLSNLDVLIVGNATPALGFYESVEFEGIEATQRLNPEDQQSDLTRLVEQAKQQEITTVLLQLRSPYITRQHIDNFDAIYASYDYQVTERKQLAIRDDTKTQKTVLFSPVFSTFIQVLTGQQIAQGVLPVTLPDDVKKWLPLPLPVMSEFPAPVEVSVPIEATTPEENKTPESPVEPPLEPVNTNEEETDKLGNGL